MAFNIKQNKDSIFIRNALIAMIFDLNKLLKIQYVNNDNNEYDVSVPFFIDLGIGSNDRFYRDFYYKNEYKDCVIINNYDKTPRIHVTPTGINLNSEQVTSPFGQAEYTEMQNGKEKWVTSFIHMLPISIDLDFTVKSNTFAEILKIWQSIVDYSIYSTVPTNFVYKGINCDASIIIEVPTINKTFSFSAEDPIDELLGFTFSGRLETFYPAIKDKYVTNIINKFNNNINNINTY